jgi:2-methylisocitrate lyase-like PEP mutase family enzyme
MPSPLCLRFHELHRSGCFVSPNPWNVGSAILLAQLGFKALATTSSGFAWSIGQRDNHITLEDSLGHLRAMSASVDIPVSADFEDGFAMEPVDVARNVTRAAATGIAGVSIEDSTDDDAQPLFEFDLAVERIRAARHALDDEGSGVLLIGRSEGYVAGRPDLRETIRRLTAYADAGADCLFAPGLRSVGDIETIVRALSPKPVNVLVSSDFTTVAAMADIGVRRISVGGALARAAWSGFFRAAREIAEHGTFVELSKATPSAEMERSFDRA